MLIEVQAMLGRTKACVEYYTIGDRFQAFIVGRDSFEVVARSNHHDDVAPRFAKGLTFQLSKFHFNPAYVQSHGPRLSAGHSTPPSRTVSTLIEPIKNELSGSLMIIGPHHVLHYIPFQALYDGEKLSRRFLAISRAPSASF